MQNMTEKDSIWKLNDVKIGCVDNKLNITADKTEFSSFNNFNKYLVYLLSLIAKGYIKYVYWYFVFSSIFYSPYFSQ